MKQLNNLSINIAYFYPKSMNIYGDYGNIICLQKRCQWKDIKVKIDEIEVGEKFDDKKYDLVFAGGGQDQSQIRIADDLQSKNNLIKNAIEYGVVFLLICGTYQLFGHYFKTHENNKIRGISVFDMKTIASNQRKIGNVIINCYSDLHAGKTGLVSGSLPIKPSTLVGFENHSGNTFINLKAQNPSLADRKSKSKKELTQPLGTVIKGFGNNGKDKTEGAVYKNCFGTYLHGSLLPKNPHFADYLIKLALENKYKQKIELKPLKDELEQKAHNFILNSR